MRFPFFAIAIFCIHTSFAQDVLPVQPLADTSKATVSLQESCSKDSIVSLSKESKDFSEKSGYSDGDWAWTYDCNEVVSTSYPVKETFYVHKKYPGYKVYAKGNAQSYEVERFVVKDNKIVWVSEVLDWSIWDPNTPTGLLQRRAYANNAYGVKRESAGVQAYIKYKLGLITSKQYRSVKVTLNDASIGMRFMEQMKSDYINLNCHSISAERLSPSSFIFIDDSDNKFKVEYTWVKNDISAHFTLIK